MAATTPLHVAATLVMDELDFERCVLAMTPFPYDGSILDLGCGPGRYALPIAQNGHDVIAVDRSQDAIDCLNGRAHDAGLSGRITTLCEDIENFEPRENISGVLCINSLHFLGKDAQYRVIRRLQDVTLPGGVHCVTAFTPDNKNLPENVNPISLCILRSLYERWYVISEGVTTTEIDQRDGKGNPIYRNTAFLTAYNGSLP